MALLLSAALTLLLLALATSLRILYLLPAYHTLGPPRDPKTQPAHILIVLGSGGHTTEMLQLLRNLDPYRYRYRTWVFSAGDAFSAARAREYEASVAARVAADGREQDLADGHGEGEALFRVVEVPRARRVHQGFASAPWSAARCLAACLWVVAGAGYASTGRRERHARRLYDYPNLIVANGPGTAVMVVLAALMLRFVDFWAVGANKPGNLRTLFFESWARVRDLSLSGKLLLHVVDRFVVQWPSLKGFGGRAEYSGWLVLDGGPKAD